MWLMVYRQMRLSDVQARHRKGTLKTWATCPGRRHVAPGPRPALWVVVDTRRVTLTLLVSSAGEELVRYFASQERLLRLVSPGRCDVNQVGLVYSSWASGTRNWDRPNHDFG